MPCAATVNFNLYDGLPATANCDPETPDKEAPDGSDVVCRVVILRSYSAHRVAQSLPIIGTFPAATR